MPAKTLQMVFMGGLAVGAALLIISPDSSDAASALKNVKQRKLSPDFLLKDSHGVEVRLSDYRGKVVLLNFWATWCGPCKLEIPWFVDFENKYKNSGLAVLGVSMDDDGWKSVRPFLEQQRVKYRVMLGDPMTTAKYGGVEALPETLLVDREGRIAAKHVGLTSKGDYQQEIVALLKERG